MAVTELATSRTINYQEGLPVGIREFYCFPYASDEDIVDLIKFGALPRKFESWPSEYIDIQPAVIIKARDYEINRDPNVQEGWFVKVIYRDLTGLTVNSLPYQPNDDGYVAIRMSSEGRFVDMYRQWPGDASFEAAVLAKTDIRLVPRFNPFDAQADIGGTKIDVAGNPTSVMMPMQRLVVDITTTRFPQMKHFRKFLGSRNAKEFLGCDQWTAVCQGIDATEINPGRWRVTLNFEIDRQYHLKQVPIRNASGYVELDQGGDTNALGRGQASRVIWVQPYPEFQFFEDIHPALKWARVF